MRIRYEPSGVTTHVESGTTLLEAALAAGVEIEAACGGRGTCGKCCVIAHGELTPPGREEHERFSAEELAAGYRLACQARVLGDVDVLVPEESRRARVRILSDGVQNGLSLEPWARRHHVRVPPASLADQRPDWANLATTLEAETGQRPEPTLRLLRELPAVLRAQEGELTVVVAQGLALRAAAGAPGGRLMGMAFDIGTTTVVGYLMDLESGEQLSVASRLNPQTRYGDDVVSRIELASRGTEGLATLQGAVLGALNEIVSEAAMLAGVAATYIMAATIVGNTTMQHLLVGIDPAALAQAPYVPAFTQGLRLSARALGLDIDPEGLVWVLPSIAGWVGADTVGVLLATGIHQQDELALAIDIGTNGEMALGSRQRLITCSTAAGPAFEGAHLSCGMRAADGAIDWIEIDGDVRWHAIGESAPRGLCGSGLVDAVAALLGAGLLDATGMLRPAEEVRANGHGALADRLLIEGRRRSFRLVDEAEGASGRAIVMSQRDVRELQLAKGAIRAGIEILMKELGIGPADVRKVYLAGAFGNYIRPESALAIGLIPRFPNAELLPVGNAAGMGAKMALLSQSVLAEASALRNVEYLELSGRPDFQDEFTEAMLLG